MNCSNAKEMDRSSLEERHREGEIEGDRLKNRSMITIFVFIPPDIYIYSLFSRKYFAWNISFFDIALISFFLSLFFLFYRVKKQSENWKVGGKWWILKKECETITPLFR